MELNGISTASSRYNTDNSSKVAKSPIKAGQETDKFTLDEAAAVYEPGVTSTGKFYGKTYTQNTGAVAQMKAAAEARAEQLRSLVEKLLLQQGQKSTDSTDIYALLREGKVQVDPATAAQAREDISENGYWGVSQTSERILSFAMSLTGGDPGKVQEMKNAVLKGFEQAREAWGGELPDICQQTYDETIKKLDAWSAGTSD